MAVAVSVSVSASASGAALGAATVVVAVSGVRAGGVGRVGTGTISVSVSVSVSGGRIGISLSGRLRDSYGLSLPLDNVDGSTGIGVIPWWTTAEAAYPLWATAA